MFGSFCILSPNKGLKYDFLDTDSILKKIYETPNSPINLHIEERFGKDIIDNGIVDQRKLRDKVFGNVNQQNLLWLVNLLTQAINNYILDYIKSFKISDYGERFTFFIMIESSMILELFTNYSINKTCVHIDGGFKN